MSNAHRIREQIAKRYKIKPETLTSRCKQSWVVEARVELMRKLRHERGLSMGQIAIYVGRDRSTVSYWVNSTTREKKLARVRERMGCPRR
jgi:chromosomal replication initiation ATPase DnaA